MASTAWWAASSSLVSASRSAIACRARAVGVLPCPFGVGGRRLHRRQSRRRRSLRVCGGLACGVQLRRQRITLADRLPGTRRPPPSVSVRRRRAPRQSPPVARPRQHRRRRRPAARPPLHGQRIALDRSPPRPAPSRPAVPVRRRARRVDCLQLRGRRSPASSAACCAASIRTASASRSTDRRLGPRLGVLTARSAAHARRRSPPVAHPPRPARPRPPAAPRRAARPDRSRSPIAAAARASASCRARLCSARSASIVFTRASAAAFSVLGGLPRGVELSGQRIALADRRRGTCFRVLRNRSTSAASVSCAVDSRIGRNLRGGGRLPRGVQLRDQGVALARDGVGARERRRRRAIEVRASTFERVEARARGLVSSGAGFGCALGGGERRAEATPRSWTAASSRRAAAASSAPSVALFVRSALERTLRLLERRRRAPRRRLARSASAPASAPGCGHVPAVPPRSASTAVRASASALRSFAAAAALGVERRLCLLELEPQRFGDLAFRLERPLAPPRRPETHGPVHPAAPRGTPAPPPPALPRSRHAPGRARAPPATICGSGWPARLRVPPGGCRAPHAARRAPAARARRCTAGAPRATARQPVGRPGFTHRAGTGSDYSFCGWPSTTHRRTSSDNVISAARAAASWARARRAGWTDGRSRPSRPHRFERDRGPGSTSPAPEPVPLPVARRRPWQVRAESTGAPSPAASGCRASRGARIVSWRPPVVRWLPHAVRGLPQAARWLPHAAAASWSRRWSCRAGNTCEAPRRTRPRARRDRRPGTGPRRRSSKRKPAGGLRVISTPVGAQVFVDGKARGVTPLTITDLAVGRHAVELKSAAGTIERTVTVAADKTAEIDESIFSGWVAVYSPFDLAVTEGGRALLMDDRHQIMLPPGRHVLRFVNRALAYDAVRQVDLKPGEVTTPDSGAAAVDDDGDGDRGGRGVARRHAGRRDAVERRTGSARHARNRRQTRGGRRAALHGHGDREPLHLARRFLQTRQADAFAVGSARLGTGSEGIRSTISALRTGR